MKDGMNIRGFDLAELDLRGQLAQFQVEKGEDCATLKVRMFDSELHIVMSQGHFDALDAALNDVRFQVGPRTGEWFGHYE